MRKFDSYGDAAKSFSQRSVSGKKPTFMTGGNRPVAKAPPAVMGGGGGRALAPGGNALTGPPKPTDRFAAAAAPPVAPKKPTPGAKGKKGVQAAESASNIADRKKQTAILGNQ